MEKHADVVLLLGCNEGDCFANFLFAKQQLQSFSNIISQSSLYKTRAWGYTDQPDFLNMAMVIKTCLSPMELLYELKKIELKTGRLSKGKWMQRCLDIDILFYDDLVTVNPELTIPHKHLHERRFTLVPLNEIIPGLRHPVLNKTIRALLIECKDDSGVEKLTQPVQDVQA